MINIKITSEQNLIEQYNQVCQKHLKAGSLLPDLTDNELFIYIAGRTYSYGRTWTKSAENASSHLEDRQKAERLFGTKKSDYLI